MTTVRVCVLSVICGALGFLLLSTAFHVWQDHGLLHQIVAFEMQRQQQRGGPPPVP